MNTFGAHKIGAHPPPVKRGRAGAGSGPVQALRLPLASPAPAGADFPTDSFRLAAAPRPALRRLPAPFGGADDGLD